MNASLPVLLEDGERKYVWGLGLAYAVESSGNVLVYHTDGLGSVRALSDGAGLVVQVYGTGQALRDPRNLSLLLDVVH